MPATFVIAPKTKTDARVSSAAASEAFSAEAADTANSDAPLSKAEQRKQKLAAWKAANAAAAAKMVTPAAAVATNKINDEEIDPLDAFMVSTEKEANKLITAAANKEAKEQEMRVQQQ